MGYYVFLQKTERMYSRVSALFLLLPFLIGCEQKKDENNVVQQYIDAIKQEVAPDKRVALFAIENYKSNDEFVLKGESNLPDGIQMLKDRLEQNQVAYVDSITLLPAAELGDSTKAIVNISVANLRSNPKHSAELATQATLGTPVKILKKEGGWYYIQTPDKYLSWVDDGGIILMDSTRFSQWQSTDKIIYQNTYGHAYSGEDEEEIISDLVAGNILEIIKYGGKHFIVHFPDGRTAFVRRNESTTYNNWLEQMDINADSLIATSKKLMGVPYLWGGTSTKGMDCSGFTKTVYFLNGMVIPRDASQQVHAGKPVDSVGNFENLERGDLLFFGRKANDSTAEKVVHVGMWIGENEFIHASDMVRISSIDPTADNFDEANKNRYLRTKRILKEKGKELMNLAQTPLFKH